MEMKRNKNGFTLIELLVVIAIIAMLLGILMPSLNRAKMAAQTLVCSANLKNYGPALQSYATDNKDKAPFMVSWLYSQKTIADASASLGLSKGCMWHYDQPDGSLWPYLAANNVHLCSVFKRNANRLGKEGCPNAATHSARTPFIPTYSYSMNWFLGFDWSYLMELDRQKLDASEMYTREISMKLSRVRNQAKCFSFSEENLWAILNRKDDHQVYSWNVLNDNALWLNANKDKPDDATDNMATYHNVNDSQRDEGKTNVVFVDGHIETLRGLAGRDAYLQYGRPYPGHENMNVW